MIPSTSFPRYETYEPKIPVWCLTPNQGRCIHRFFDTSPISPSGRYVAVFRLPFEDRLDAPGDRGQVVLIDLTNGTERVVAETAGWESQMGPNINWGATDEMLAFNDVDTSDWSPMLVRLNPLAGKRVQTPGGVYHVSPDGCFAAASSLERMRRTQIGYGVHLPEDRIPRNIGAIDDDGLFITDLTTGERRLALSLADAVKSVPDLAGQNLADWEIYGFHSKWSPDGKRLVFTIRRFATNGPNRFSLITSREPAQQLHFDVLTVSPDGNDVCDVIPDAYWRHGGHHTNWLPDSRSLSMNLGGFGEGLRFCRVDARGGKVVPMVKDVRGSGHPTVHPDGRHILTDAYDYERGVAFGDGTVPLRWVDMATGREETLVRIGVRTEPQPNLALRVDPHPAWSRDWRLIVFNGVIPGDNTRRVFLGDMSSVIG